MRMDEAALLIRNELRNIYDDGEASAIADVVLEHLTGIKRSARISKDQLIDSSKTEHLHNIITRLKTHEPLQYVINEAWFCGLKFYVDKSVLIPRPETEELVEWIISNCKFPISSLKILDVGCGSGCIPIALRRRLGKAEVWGCDVSKDALAIADRNAESLGVTVNFVELDFLNPDKRSTLPSFDIIVSNPPYIPESGKDAMAKNVTHFEPAIALFVPNEDALIFYRALAEFGKKNLMNDGSLYAEIHEDLGLQVVQLMQSYGYTVELKKDMSGKERFVRAIKSPGSQH